MEPPPAFFVPAATPETQESVYGDLAKMGQRSVPPIASRIYSISYTHDGEEWTATVGEKLNGMSFFQVALSRQLKRASEARESAGLHAIAVAVQTKQMEKDRLATDYLEFFSAHFGRETPPLP